VAEQYGEKTHDATPYRRRKAREEGNVAKSQDLASAVMLLGAVLVVWYLGVAIVKFLFAEAEGCLGAAPAVRADNAWAAQRLMQVTAGAALALGPLLAAMAAIAALGHIGQVGLLFVPKKLAFDGSRIDPLKGAQRIFSVQSLVRLGLGIFKILVVGAVAAISLYHQWDAILGLGERDVRQIALYISDVTFWTTLKIAIALIILALLDFAYQKHKYEQDLKMTTQELKEEMKTTQGDPQVAARRRQVQRQLALQRMGSAIPQADVVVTNPTELAIALKYNINEMEAPVVVAKGSGTVAARIRRLALENDIPVVERKELARILYKQCEVNQQVPVEQYAAVAEVLRYVYELKGKKLPELGEAA